MHKVREVREVHGVRYSDEVLRRVRDPQRVGSLDGDHVGTGEAGTLDDGTVVRIQVRREGDRIAEARFKVFGCSAAIASASLVAEWLEGATMALASTMTTAQVVQQLALAPEREHVARMAVEAGLTAVRSVRLRSQGSHELRRDGAPERQGRGGGRND